MEPVAVKSKKSLKRKTEKSTSSSPKSARVDESNTPVLEAPESTESVRVDPPVTEQAAASSEVTAEELGDNIESHPGPEAASSVRSYPEDISAKITEQLQDLNLPEGALEGPSTSAARIRRRSKGVAVFSDDSDSSSDRGLVTDIDFSKKAQTSSSEITSNYDSACTTPCTEDSNGEHATINISSNGSDVTISEEPTPSTSTVPLLTHFEQLTPFEQLEVNTRAFKVIFLGDVGVGKTSLIHRLVDEVFIANYYKPTIGVDFRIKNIRLSNYAVARLLIYDLAGRESMSDLSRVYYRRSNGAVIVFDESSTTDFHSVVEWKKQLDDTVMLPDGSPIPCLLLGNKSDLGKRTIGDETMANFVQTLQFKKFFETSAKDGTGIHKAIKYLTQLMLAQVRHMYRSALAPRREPERKTCKCSR